MPEGEFVESTSFRSAFLVQSLWGQLSFEAITSAGMKTMSVTLQLAVLAVLIFTFLEG